MIKDCLKIGCVISLAIGIALGGYTSSAVAQTLASKLQSGEYIQKADNFIVILDASGSKNDPVDGHRKLELAKDIVNRMNLAISGLNLKLVGALRTYGKGEKLSSKNKTELIYGPRGYFAEDFGNALKTVKRAGGLTFMASAIDAASDDILSLTGRTAVIIISDGKVHTDNPIQAAERMNQRHGNKVCIYTIFIPSDTADIHQVAKDKELMRQIARASRCGYAVISEDIASDSDIIEFAENIFFESVSDRDGDGVPNETDDCPDTPPNALVDARGCPTDGKSTNIAQQTTDMDKDGVDDMVDDCLNTPKGATVTENGCWVVENLHFEFNKWDIAPQYYTNLDAVLKVLKENPDLRIEIHGHTDNVGTEAYNKELSQKRADAVMQYFLKQGIDRERLYAEGYGFSKPVDSNETEEGRAKNRRVELHPVY